MDRHTRHVRLAAVGAEGQARIGRAVVDVPGRGLAAVVAARYLAGAGVACVRVQDPAAGVAARAVDAGVRVEIVPTLTAPGVETPVELRDSTARELASGALLALQALRRALEERS